MVTARFSSLAALALATANAASIADVPPYVVPSVDFSQLFANTPALLDAMQHDGILSLKNIPEYATRRRAYLRKAAECAVHAEQHGAEFLLHRRLQDGTQRYTISTESGRRLDASGFETVERCPGYQQVYHEFSRTIEDAVAKVGRALDASKALQVSRRRLNKKGMDAMTAHELMTESVHLDHFHAYEASRTLTEKTLEELSLEMHTDNGLMITMTAPEYFDVAPSGEVVSHETRTEDAGLLIKTASGQTVRPLLQADELVLMLGEGINTWIHTTPALRSVTHGMQYPRGLSYVGDNHKSLRAWFGKMILLSEDHVMANTGLTYGEFANQTTRYLKDAANDKGFAAIACSPHRHLQASDNKCTVRTGCKLKPGASETIVFPSCAITCNHKAAADQKICAENCDCDADSSVDGSTCWMLCVPAISSSDCAGEQKCNSATKKEDLAMTCVATGTSGNSITTLPNGSSPSGSSAAPTTTTPAPTTASPSNKPTKTPSPKPSSSSSGSSAPSTTQSPAATVSAPELTESSQTSDASGSGQSSATVTTTKPSSTSKPTPKPTTSAATATSVAGVVAMTIAMGASLLI